MHCGCGNGNDDNSDTRGSERKIGVHFLHCNWTTFHPRCYMLENLTLFLWGLYQNFKNLTLCIDKLYVWESVILEAVRDVLL